MSSRYDVVVVGGGLHGLATAFHLTERKVRAIALLEQFRLQHRRASSHGATRITRSSYADAAYVELMRVAREEEWPRLEREAGEPLVVPCEGIFFGPPGGGFDDHVRHLSAYGGDVELVPREIARARFPLFRFDDAPEVLVDRTAGVVLAERTLAALARTVAARGVVLHENVRVSGVELASDRIVLKTSSGEMSCDRLVVAAGPWAPALLPELAPKLRPVRQNVGYFRLSCDRELQRVGRFPVFVHLGAGPNGSHYGLPSLGDEGLKVARHVTHAPGDDPDSLARPDESALAEVRAFLDRTFVVPVEERVSAETCFYTSTDDEDYVIDVHPRDPRVVVGAGFSGHGFKLGPLTGRILAELVLHRRSTVEAFERRRAKFAW